MNFRIWKKIQLPRSPVRDPPQAGRDPRGDLPQHRLGVGQVDTAVEVHVIRHSRPPCHGL
jgi:hypothetical protein